jgi:iron complex outermembrane receptor protein
MFPSAGVTRCSDPQLAARFTFANGVCSAANFLGVRTNQINGPTVDTSGIDFEARYLWDGVFGGQLELGIDGNHMFEYQRGAVTTLEGITVAAATDRAGTLELLSNFFAYPKWRGNAHVNYAMDAQNFRLDYHVIGSMLDRNHNLATAPAINWATVSGYHQFDLTYLITVIDRLTITAAVQNVTDQKPSFAYSQYNYDYTSANPLGRVYELGVRVKF